MKLEGKFEYKKALILTPNRIQELESIFLKYCMIRLEKTFFGV